jgi:hypothetical protein
LKLETNRNARSAGCQPAVSPIANRLAVTLAMRSEHSTTANFQSVPPENAAVYTEAASRRASPTFPQKFLFAFQQPGR